MMSRAFRTGLKELTHVGLRRRLYREIASGKFSETTKISSVLDSLEMVELGMLIEEPSMTPSVPVETVRDLLWLINPIEFRLQRSGRTTWSHPRDCHLGPGTPLL